MEAGISKELQYVVSKERLKEAEALAKESNKIN
jgi:hypothetical protein